MTASTPIPVGQLIFGDEFDGPAGSKPSAAKWVGKTRGLSSGIHLDGMTNISLDGKGNVVITAHKASDGWHSGFLSAVPIGGYTGRRYIECRAKVAHGLGTWSGAVWEWPAPYGTTSQSEAIELDICEQLGREPTEYHATLHNWYGGNQQVGYTIPNPGGANLGDNFHVYAAAVYDDHIDYYLDGVHAKNMHGLPATVTAKQVGLVNLAQYKVVPNISLNMGGWGGTISVPGPVYLTADYIHVYRLP